MLITRAIPLLPVSQQDATLSSKPEDSGVHEQIRISRCLRNYRLKKNDLSTNCNAAPVPFEKKFPTVYPRPLQSPPQVTTSKILPLINQNTETVPSPLDTANGNNSSQQSHFRLPKAKQNPEKKFPDMEAPPYVPHSKHSIIGQCSSRPFVTRANIPIFSAIPPPPSVPIFSALPPPPPTMLQPRPTQNVPPFRIRQAKAQQAKKKDLPQTGAASVSPSQSIRRAKVTMSGSVSNQTRADVINSLEQLRM